ncbi:dihydroneopterin aldolase family protein [Methanobrevibacter arboriphilus]|uniref:dihydroneopterin aldolase family protein n=1 Tax=Methanobrevibacter arboriphilus TaxID=39441 RepID=UPI000A8AA166|nr:dihydroneopterin aldolase family protein [Methanobrevibacter arboriphilus]
MLKKNFFSNITFRERAIFEGAISMGALFHQFIGTPVNKETVNSLELAIEKSLSLQPAIEKVEVDINLDILEREISEFEYTSLTGDMIDVKIYSKVNKTLAIIRMKFIEELNYPLMFIEDIQEDINENIQK